MKLVESIYEGEILMANYHLEVCTVSRGRGRSVTKLANYISGQKLHDSYNDRTYYNRRQDVLYLRIFLPENAPPDFNNLQHLCDKIEGAERRYDARTAREFKCSLPNELPIHELVLIINEFINHNFLAYGLCAIAAIHEGKNKQNPLKNNPHVHIIVPTRTVGADGFNPKKDREHDKRAYINIWREQWALVQNRAYERNKLDIRVSHENLNVQGKQREPLPHLSRIDWQKELRGEHTCTGDKKRAIKARNQKHIRQRHIALERSFAKEPSR